MVEHTFRSAIFAFLLVFLFSCKREHRFDFGGTTPAGWSTCATRDYSIGYPSGYELNTSGLMGTALILLSPRTGPNDLFRENANLNIQDLGGQKLTLAEYTEISVEQIRSLITNSDIIENSSVKSPKGDYQKLVYTGDEGRFHLLFTQYCALVDGKAWILTFTAEQTQADRFREVFEQIRRSFVVR